jgi:hypothetical protein
MQNALLILPLPAPVADYKRMRFFPISPIAWLLCALVIAPASLWAQHMHCEPCMHAFGKVQIGTSASLSIQLMNTGSKALRINSKSVSGSGFAIGSFPVPVTVNPGASVQMPVTFTPTAKGYTDAYLTINSNADNSPTKIHVAGTGYYTTDPTLSISPSSLNFGNVTVNTTASLQITLTPANGSITISSDGSTSSEFAITGISLPVTIPQGKTQTATITFTPNASGAASGNLGFTSNAVDSPLTEPATGTGVAGSSHSVYLTWKSGGGGAVGYNVYRGTVDGGPYSMINSSLDPNTNYTDSSVSDGATYYYVATEVNSEGQESAYSNIGSATIPNN